MHRHTRIALFILCGIFAAFASAAATQRADAAKIWHAPGSHDLRARTIKKIVPRYTASRKTHRGQRYTGFKKVHRGQLYTGFKKVHRGQRYTGFKKVHRGQRYTGFKKVHRGQRYTGFKKVYSGPRYLSQSY
jgi:hypothetical protein